MEAGNLTNFIPNISAQTSKFFIYCQLNNGLPSAGQTMWLYNFKSQVKHFFQPWKMVLILALIGEHIHQIGQYQTIISANWYVGWPPIVSLTVQYKSLRVRKTDRKFHKFKETNSEVFCLVFFIPLLKSN